MLCYHCIHSKCQPVETLSCESVTLLSHIRGVYFLWKDKIFVWIFNIFVGLETYFIFFVFFFKAMKQISKHHVDNNDVTERVYSACCRHHFIVSIAPTPKKREERERKILWARYIISIIIRGLILISLFFVYFNSKLRIHMERIEVNIMCCMPIPTLWNSIELSWHLSLVDFETAGHEWRLFWLILNAKSVWL